MEIIELSLEQLKPYNKNPRKNDKAIKYVANSIKEFGFKNPIIIDKDNVIIAGHTRYEASKKLGLEKVPCIMASDLSEEQVKAFRLADNKVSEISEWDNDLLLDELNDIINIDMSAFNFDINVDLDDIVEKDIEDKANYNENYSIIVKCENDVELEETFYKLTQEGYKCQISTL